MQIIFLPDWALILSYFLFWPIVQIPIAILGNQIDDHFFNPNSFWLKTRKWEAEGEFYNRIFKIRKWKHLLPDGARVHKNGFRKKHVNNYSPEYLESFIAETGRAEIFHWFQILPFWLVGFWSPPYVIFIMLAYALLVNLPCIIAQRYNRPRILKIYYLQKQKQK